MSFSKADQAFFDWLDEQPCTSNGVLVRGPRGEMRNVSHDPARQAFEFRTRGRVAPHCPRLEAAKARLALLGALMEREERA
jgi:hypothetical protein